MNIDTNIERILRLLLKKWKVLVIFGIIGVMLGYVYTSSFTTLTYSSTVEFLAYAVDTNQELSGTQQQTPQHQISNTSKMNYAMNMMPTYIELFKTNEFNMKVADELNDRLGTAYTASQIKGAISIVSIEDTALFKFTVTTTDPEMSYQIAHQLESSVPEAMSKTNSGLVNASVEDMALKPTSYENLGYFKKCTIGFIGGAIIAAVILILKDMLDVRIKSSEELSERYDIPVLGTIPDFEIKTITQKNGKKEGN